MKTLEFKSGLEPKKKLMVILFWTNRKSARTEGCAPFKLLEITTPEKTYQAEGNKPLKLSDEIMDDLAMNIEEENPLYFEISIGNEIIKASLEGNTYTVSTTVSPEIEEEIVEKLNMELQKKYPNICESFTPRVTPLK